MNLLEDLNQQQRRAVEETEGACLIIAGAGSGKTRVLTYKIAYLLDSGVKPQNILALTFTNKAANEMKSRIVNLVGSHASDIWMGTFHSIFARILRREAHLIGYDRNYTIYDEQDSKKIIDDTLHNLNLNTDKIRADTFKSSISKLKNRLIFPEDYTPDSKNIYEKYLQKVYTEYQSLIYKSNAMDFDDLLIQPIVLYQKHPEVLKKYQQRFKFIFVDEYQDTNKAQYIITKMLSEGHGNITVVGDDAQSIYSWRGAEIENILKFENDFEDCRIFKLEQNYRSTKNILSVADTVIKNNKRQIHKNLFTKNHEGEKVALLEVASDKSEAEAIVKYIMNEIHNLKLNFKDFVVLYRTNAQSRTLEEAMRKNSIPYIIIGGVKFYQRKEIKDVLAYFKMLVNPRDNESVIRVLRQREGIGESTIGRLQKHAAENKLPLADAVLNISKDGEDNKRQTKIATELSKLANLMETYLIVKNKFSLKEFAGNLVNEIGIIRRLREEGTEEAMERMYNVQELLSGISEYCDTKNNPSLEEYLQEVSLVTDVDTYDNKKNAVTLMTTHAVKGLEYPVVFISGLEEGLFPLYSSTESESELEEERRLFYVAITRAEKKLYMSYALERYRFGTRTSQYKSRFLSEVDHCEIDFIKQEYQRVNRKRKVNEPGSTISYEFFGEEDGNGTGDIYEEKDNIRKGSIVYHDNFGKGKVIELTGKGENKKAKIHFDKAGLKRIMIKYANLKLKY